jgi:MerR family Zn(II)-responsive transcriptional regulator of zntA
MLIGELARVAGMTVEGVRFYERSGLLVPAGRSRGGYRLYGPEAQERLAFVRQAQAVGLSLEEIRRVVALSEGGVRPCKEVQAFMRARVADIDRRQRELRALRRRLTETLARWEAAGEPPAGAHVCGLIEAAAGEHPGGRRRSIDSWRSSKAKSTSARTPTADARSG